MDITCISDLHGYYPKLEGGDLLIIAGDLTTSDQEKQYDDFWRWLCYQNYKKKIVIAGNHDNFLQKNPGFLKDCGQDIEYLCDSGIEFEYEEDVEEEHKFKGMISYKSKKKLKIWGSPWTQTFPGMNPHCKAFTVDTEEELAEKFKLIPNHVDILITHNPPYGIFDKLERYTSSGRSEEYVGSISLRNKVMDIKPSLHCFGHIHEHGGKMIDTVITKFVNASHVNEVYEPVNKPIRIIL